MSRLDDITTHGNHPHRAGRASKITCADGFTLSVIAGGGAYCSPRPMLAFRNEVIQPDGITGHVPSDYPGPYSEVEVGYPSERPEPWDEWAEWCEDPGSPTGTVYGWVPVEVVRALIESHGGEAC